jgi:hypothetical protein
LHVIYRFAYTVSYLIFDQLNAKLLFQKTINAYQNH